VNQNEKLFNACKTGDLKTVKHLVESGANIHAADDFTLRWATAKGHTKIVNYLKLVKNLKALKL
jgi:ankyrin repeat protein